MNNELTNAIVKHIFSGLGLFGSVPVSIQNDLFLTDKKVSYLAAGDEQDHERTAPVWACQTMLDSKKLAIICTTLRLSASSVPDTEHFVVIKLDDNPGYGCYASAVDIEQWTGIINDLDVQDGFIATQLKSQAWIPANTYLQATFLAGMEQLKDLTSRYDKGSKVEDMFGLLKQFIAYRESMEDDGNNQV